MEPLKENLYALHERFEEQPRRITQQKPFRSPLELALGAVEALAHNDLAGEGVDAALVPPPQRRAQRARDVQHRRLLPRCSGRSRSRCIPNHIRYESMDSHPLSKNPGD